MIRHHWKYWMVGVWLGVASTAQAAGFTVTRVQSHYSVPVTVGRLERNLKAHGVTVFATVDHAALARRVHLPLRPEVLVIFGNPALGTPYMEKNPESGLDLPMKLLVWTDAHHVVWVGYRDPSTLTTLNHIQGLGPLNARVRKVLAAFARQAAGDSP